MPVLPVGSQQVKAAPLEDQGTNTMPCGMMALIEAAHHDSIYMCVYVVLSLVVCKATLLTSRCIGLVGDIEINKFNNN